MVQIIPAVLATTEKQYLSDITKLEQTPTLKEGWVHIDFADNIFVQNLTIEPEIIQKFPTNLRKEAHLMVSHPREWVDKLIEAGFERIIFHIEAKDDIQDVIDYIKDKGLEVGLAINNETAIEKIEPFAGKIDIILVMTIVPGFQGQPFIPAALEKIKEIKSKGWNVKLGVDGHVNSKNAKEIMDAGVDFMVVGSYLLKGELDENLENLWEVIDG